MIINRTSNIADKTRKDEALSPIRNRANRNLLPFDTRPPSLVPVPRHSMLSP